MILKILRNNEIESCAKCDVLREQLAFERKRIQQLMDFLLKTEEVQEAKEEIKPIYINGIHSKPWSVRQKELEQESLARSNAAKRNNIDLDELEKEVGLDVA